MKKIISFICTIALMCTVLAPLAVVEVSAAAKDPWADWLLENGAYVEDGVLVLKDLSSAKLNGQLPDQYTLSFSMKVDTFGGSMYFQAVNGIARGGFYIGNGRIRAMDDQNGYLTVADMGSWHDYVLEIDTIGKTQKVYVDDVFIGTHNLDKTSSRNLIHIGSPAGAGFRVSDFSLTADSAVPGADLKVPEGYSEAFFEDFHTTDGWMVDTMYVTHYPEDGIIRLHQNKETQVYRSVEKPLRPPTNYDAEFRIKMNELPEDIFSGRSMIELSTDSRHAWLYIYEDHIAINNYSLNGEDPLYDGPQNAIMYTIGYDWHTFKAEVRDKYVTWYVDDQLLMSYRMLGSSANRWHIAIFQQNEGNLGSDISVDWVKYTPYFEDSLKMVSPVNGTEMGEEQNVLLKAETTLDTDKIDYYVNNAYVGSGYKADDYAYVLKNMKIGTYNVKAKVENVETAEWTFVVNKSFEAELVADRDSIKTTESVKVTANAKSASQNSVATKAEFYLNGQLYSTDNAYPFETTLSNLKVGTASVYAKVYNATGTFFETEPKLIKVNYAPEKAIDITQEYELNYDYVSGNGKVELSDGYFKLSLANNGETLTYLTDEGEKTYSGLGAGTYKVVATAGHAELYWKNQFVVSFLMPHVASDDSLNYSGVSNLNLGGSGVKAERYHIDWNGKTELIEDTVPDTKYYSIEFDKKDASSETLEFYDGIFENVISFREDGIYAKRQLTGHAEVTELKLSDKVEAGYYRLTVGFGIAQLFRNNVLVGGYRCPLAGNRRMLIRKVSNPQSTTFVSIKNTDDVYYHTEDFEENSEITYSEYWMVQPETYRTYKTDSLTPTRKTEGGNSFMSIKGQGVYIINGLDLNPSIKWRGRFDSEEGKAYLVLRRSYGDSHTKMGYDFGKKQWFFDIVESNGEVLFSAVKPDATVKSGEWHNFELVADDFNVSLLMDGKNVFDVKIDNSTSILRYGRFGFGLVGSAYSFDDLVYVGKGRVSPGITMTTGGNYGASSVVPGTFFKGADGTIYGTNLEGSVISKDGGLTWGEYIPAASNTDRTLAKSVVKMPDGTLVQLTGNANTGSFSKISKDGGKSWSSEYLISADHGSVGAVSRLTCTKSGRLFVCTTQGAEEFGVQFVFYSDDGINWTKSATDFTTYNTGIVMNEAIVIDTPRENEVWFYGRSNSGFLDYWVSYDNGATFDLTPHHSGLIHPETCFRIERDWDEEETYYAINIYDTETSNQRYIQQPRKRVGIVVSRDGMKTWEYITDLMEGNEWGGTGHTSDSIVFLIDNVLIWRTANAEGYGGQIFGAQKLEYVKSLKRYPELRERTFIGYDVLATTAQNHSVLPKTDGKAWIYGDFYDVKVADGRVDVATAEKMFGVAAQKNGSGVTLCLGDGKVTFTEGSTSYDVNGAAKIAERAVYANGYLDIKTLCEIYGRAFREADNSYSILDKAESVDKFQKMIDRLAG